MAAGVPPSGSSGGSGEPVGVLRGSAGTGLGVPTRVREPFRSAFPRRGSRRQASSGPCEETLPFPATHADPRQRLSWRRSRKQLDDGVARSAASGNGCRLALPEDRAESLTNPSGFLSASAGTSLGNPTRVQGTIRPGSSRRESEASLLGSPRAPAYPAPPFPVSVRTLPKGLGHEPSSPEQAQS